MKKIIIILLIFPFATQAQLGIFGDGNIVNTSGSSVMMLKTTQKVGIGGITSPTSVLHLPAGTATANTAPLKINSGTLLSSVEDGAMEYASSHIYFTIGGTRYQLDQQGSSGITTLNTLTTSTQTFATGTSGTDFNISSSSSTHTFNIPSASTSNRGLITTSTQTLGGVKTFHDGLVATSSTVVGRVIISGDLSLSAAPGISGIGLVIPNMTYTDNGASRTVSGSDNNFNVIRNPVVTSGNAVTYADNTINLKIDGAPVATGSMTLSHPWAIYANDDNFFQTLALGLNEQNASTTLGEGSAVVYNGAGGHTFTLPALSVHPGKVYLIKNAGGGNLTVQRGGSDNIYDTSSVTSIVVAAGAHVVLVAGTSFWYAQ